MKKIRVEDAVGLPLAHDITEMKDGFKGAAFKRGQVITQEDIPHLLNIGKKNIFIWEENAGEIHEDDAAQALAQMTWTDNISKKGPSEGKILFFAETDGMFRVNTDLLRQINSIGDITITTLPDHYPVKKGARLASMRIVPLVTQKTQIEKAEELCKDNSLVRLLPYKTRKAGIIITGSEIYSGRITDKFQPVLRKKLSQYPCEIVGVEICDDSTEMIEQKAKSMLKSGADFLIFTGGMSVDPDDITPTAIRQLGADIITHGVPAQPGNMTLAAYLGDIPVLGVPGAAIIMPTTILDVLLPAIFAGEKITKKDLINLADGGLCQICQSCHWPNCTFGRY